MFINILFASSLLYFFLYSDQPKRSTEAMPLSTKVTTEFIEFQNDVDLLEQIRFRRRYQRKLLPGEADVITLQDVKDIAIFTAPANILSPMLINMLHLPTTDRFLRALILCSAYYLQVADEMARRIAELDTKVRTPDCDILENEYRDNLADLRILVAKEYCLMLIGGGDTKKVHHMGPKKQRQSLSDRDSRLFETFLGMSVQIVWLALGRKSFHQIELEANRLFKTEIFNVVEHNLKSGYISKMSAEERAVLVGRCVRRDKKINTRSPLMNEVFCNRDIDCRLMGLGVVKYNQITRRLWYLRHAVSAKEEELQERNVTLGIIGLPRSSFDTMLRPLPQVTATSAHSSCTLKMSLSGDRHSSTKKFTSVPKHLYPEIHLPPRDDQDRGFVLLSFSEELETVQPVNDVQRCRWLHRLKKLTRK